MRKRRIIEPMKGRQPLTGTVSEKRIKKKKEKINKEQVYIDKCLNCTKEKCKGNCELVGRL
jgi:hypothetical protein